jgi:hypothetical protein
MLAQKSLRTNLSQSSQRKVKTDALISSSGMHDPPILLGASWTWIDKGCPRGLRVQAGMHFHFAGTWSSSWATRRRPESIAGGDRSKPVLEHHRRPEARGPEEATERRLARGCLHMAVAYWCVPEVVT